MPDDGQVPDATLSAADQAVKYLLDRIQLDPNLRYYCGNGTESFALLVAAEAARTGETVEAVKDRRCVRLTPSHRPQMADVYLLRREVEALRDKHQDWER